MLNACNFNFPQSIKSEVGFFDWTRLFHPIKLVFFVKCLRCFSDIVLALEGHSFAMSCCGAFKCGTLLRVDAVAGKRYYKAKILKVINDQIHYINWSSGCDEALSGLVY